MGNQQQDAINKWAGVFYNFMIVINKILGTQVQEARTPLSNMRMVPNPDPIRRFLIIPKGTLQQDASITGPWCCAG